MTKKELIRFASNDRPTRDPEYNEGMRMCRRGDFRSRESRYYMMCNNIFLSGEEE